MGVLFDDFPSLSESARELWSLIVPTFDTFCFCRRYLDHEKIPYSESALAVCELHVFLDISQAE